MLVFLKETPLKKVLIVDDEAGVREVLEAALSIIPGIQILTATNGRDGLVTALREKPEVVISDIDIPEMNGLELAAKLKKAAIPVILVTGGMLRGHEMPEGVELILYKPFRMKEIQEVVSNLLNS